MEYLPFSTEKKGFSGENCSMKIQLALNRMKLRKKKRAEMAEGIHSSTGTTLIYSAETRNCNFVTTKQTGTSESKNDGIDTR
jgi:hypothetical protein